MMHAFICAIDEKRRYLVPEYYLKGLRWDLQTLKVNPFGMLCVSLATDLKPSLGLGMTAFNTLVGLTIILSQS